MNMRFGKSILLACAFALTNSVTGSAQSICGVTNQIYCQEFEQGFSAWASQNDAGGLGNFATSYDHFTLGQAYNLQSFHWVGIYFNPGGPGDITAFTLTFYNDNAGIPGSVAGTYVGTGNGGENDIGAYGAYEAYAYSLSFPDIQLGPGTYWASVVADQLVPPEWGWSTSVTVMACGLPVSSFTAAAPLVTRTLRLPSTAHRSSRNQRRSR